MSDDANQQTADLQRQLNQLKAAISPAPIDPAAEARCRSEMHELAERRAGLTSGFSRGDLADMERAAPTNIVRDIAMRDNRCPTGRPPVLPSNQPVPNVRGAGGSSGWAREAPLGPPPGINHIDRMMAAEDREFRRERARQAAALKAVEPK